jgi:hypothetical protein
VLISPDLLCQVALALSGAKWSAVTADALAADELVESAVCPVV